MKTVLVMICLCVMTLAVPVSKKIYKVPTNFPSFVEVEASNPEAAVRKARQIIDVDVDIYNNNGNGYFGMC